MSVVTNLIVTAPLCAQTQVRDALEAFTVPRSYPPFTQVDSHAGGDRSMECCVWMAALNWMNLQEFMEHLAFRTWTYRELVSDIQLMVRGQRDDRFTVYLLQDGTWTPEIP
jgi:hypothetical protein